MQARHNIRVKVNAVNKSHYARRLAELPELSDAPDRAVLACPRTEEDEAACDEHVRRAAAAIREGWTEVEHVRRSSEIIEPVETRQVSLRVGVLARSGGRSGKATMLAKLAR